MSKVEKPEPLSPLVNWLILGTAALGFAFDIYELLMLPLVGPPAIEALTGAAPGSDDSRNWMSILFYVPAFFGGIFGLIGGWLTDLFGRRTVLTYSILLYAGATFAAAWSPNMYVFLAFRSLAFVGVCVEFVAAVAWLAEIYTDPGERERAIGYTQAFSSFGGLLVTAAYALILWLGNQFPDLIAKGDAWRYLLMSGLIPALPLMLVRPFLPESPAWEKKSLEGTLKRPSLWEIFSPELRQTTIVTTILFACSYGVAFGAIQQISQIIPQHGDVKAVQQEKLSEKGLSLKNDPDKKAVKMARGIAQEYVKDIQFWQEVGGLLGRFALALIVGWALSRRALLLIFLIPCMLLTPIVFYLIPEREIGFLYIAIFFVGFFTVAQFSFWGNYLPRVYPLHLRGTGESFAANIGGRMLGTLAAVAATQGAVLFPGTDNGMKLAYASAATAGVCMVVAFIASFWLPEPTDEELPD